MDYSTGTTLPPQALALALRSLTTADLKTSFPGQPRPIELTYITTDMDVDLFGLRSLAITAGRSTCNATRGPAR